MGGMNAYNVVHQNSLDYREHPVASVFGAVIVSPLAGLITYWLSGLFARRSGNTSASNTNSKTNQIDDKFYDEVARELKENNLVAGLWTKAFAEMSGDDAKARALYIKYRVEQLRNKAALEIESQKSEAKIKAKQQCLAANPPLSGPVKAANLLVGIFCGILSLIFIGALALSVIDGISRSDMDEVFGAVTFLGCLTFGFGVVTFQCFKAATR